MKTKKFMALSLYCAFFLANTAVLAEKNDFIEALEREVAAQQSAAGSELGVNAFGEKDVSLDLTASLKTEYERAHNANLLNSDIGDRTSRFKNRIDLGIEFAYGEEKYGYPAFEVTALLRHKQVAGDFKYDTDDQTARIGSSHVGSHSHSINYPLTWFKNLYGTISLNALFNRHRGTRHELKFGTFDYQLGRGIVYGPFHGFSKPFLGVFTALNDFGPFGACLSGEIVEDKIGYELYWTRLEEFSGRFKDAFNHDKAHINREQPASGPGRSNDLFALKLISGYDFGRAGALDVEVYSMYNRALDQKVEMAKDSDSSLYSSGIMAEYAVGNWEFGGEAAFNWGEESLKAVDRNVIAGGGYPSNSQFALPSQEYYSHVYLLEPGVERSEASDTHTYHAHKLMHNGYIATKIADNTIDMYSSRQGGRKLGTVSYQGVEYDVYSEANRFRPSYSNRYRGWMAVADASYNLKRFNVKFNAAVAYATGDVNPHDVEKDKDYKGFVGLHENYAGKRVPSVMLLDARKNKRPTTLNSETGKLVFDNSFSDILSLGGGIAFKALKEKCDVKINALGFWKDAPSNAYNAGENKVEEVALAGDYYGTEMNTIIEHKLFDNLKLSIKAALFLPGSYYKSIAGMPLDSSVFNKLDSADVSGYTQKAYRMGTDIAQYFNASFSYNF